jgi:hypothetical protein
MELNWCFISSAAGSALRVLFFGSLIPQLLQNFDLEICFSAVAYGAISIFNLPMFGRDDMDVDIWNFSALISGSWVARSIFFNGTMRFVSWPVTLDVLRMLLHATHMFPFKTQMERWIRSRSLSSTFLSPDSVSSDIVDWAIFNIRQHCKSHARTWSQNILEQLGSSLSTVGLALKQLSIENMEVVRTDGDVAFVRFEGKGKIEIGIDADLRFSGKFLVVEDATVRNPHPPTPRQAAHPHVRS